MAKKTVIVRMDEGIPAPIPEPVRKLSGSESPGVTNDAPAAQASVTKPEPFTITDPHGRRIVLRKPAIIEQFRLAEKLKEVSDNPAYMAMATPVLWVRSIDDEEILPPETKTEFEATLVALDDGYVFETFETRDGAGRRLTLQRPTVLQQFRLIEALKEVVANQTYMMMATPATWVRAVDGVAIAQPASKADLEAIIVRLDEDGLAAALTAVQECVQAEGDRADAFAAVISGVSEATQAAEKAKAAAKAAREATAKSV